jgi:nucleoside-diphosphate-sugar epimerase
VRIANSDDPDDRGPQRIFVAGATGVLGRRAAAQLVATGADVTGVARSQAKQAELRRIGVTPVLVSLFDRDALAAVVAGHDAVANLATAIPTGTRAGERSAWEDNHRIRREGARNLVDAALAAGASRYVQESVTLLYADGGEQWLDESAPVDATGIIASSLVAEAEAARFAEGGGAGVALRFGYFYGFDSAHIIDAVEAAKAGLPAQLGPAEAYRPSISTDDAAAAVVAALRAPSGLYNIADDRPLRRSEFGAALTEALGIAPLAQPTFASDLPPEFACLVRSQRISHQRFTAATGWRPRFPSAREGLRFVVAELQQRHAVRSGGIAG